MRYSFAFPRPVTGFKQKTVFYSLRNINKIIKRKFYTPVSILQNLKSFKTSLNKFRIFSIFFCTFKGCGLPSFKVFIKKRKKLKADFITKIIRLIICFICPPGNSKTSQIRLNASSSFLLINFSKAS